MHLGGKFERLGRFLVLTALFFSPCLQVVPTARAGDGDLSVPGSDAKLSVSPNSKSADPDDLASHIFVEDRITLEFMSGAMFSPSGIGPAVPTFNYQQNNVRLGWMLDSPDSWGPQAGLEDPLRGNFEAILEATGSYVWYSFGTYMVGVTGLVRYNFVQPDWIVVPYIQGGAGIIYSNARNWSNQDAIGANVEFTPQFAGGLKFLLDKNWTFNAEGSFQHISNANTSARNQGVNAYGGFVGFTYVFDKIWSD
jgi:hypothetical protein